MDDIRQRLEEFKASMEKPRPDAVTRAKPETALQRSFDEYRMAQQEARERLLSELPSRAVSGAIPGAVGALSGYGAQIVGGLLGDLPDLYQTYKPESFGDLPASVQALPTTGDIQDLLREYINDSPEFSAGMTGGNAFALAQGAAALPALVKGAAKGAPKLLGNLIDEILAPRSGPSGQRGAITYHGSPHRFPPTANNPLGEFDAAKIGTGEGAQAYGHGLYLAEDPSVGAAYRRQLSGTVQRPDVEYKGKDYLSGHISGIEGQAVSTIADALAKDIPITDAIKQAREIAKARFARDVKQVRSAGMGVDEFLQSPEEYKALLKQIKETDPSSLKRIGDPRDPGNLYKVDLPDEQIAKMLDWDKPLEGNVASQIVRAAEKTKSMNADDFKDALGLSRMYEGQPESGSSIYSLISGSLGSNAKASEWLKKNGIPGIRYLDQGSRSGGAGTSNFVVFDPKHMNIVGREKKGGPVSQDVMNLAVLNKKVQHKQVGGGIKGVKAVMNAAEELMRLKAAIAPAYSSKIMDSTTARFIDKIAKENPKFTNEEVIKKATIQAKKKLDWERVNKPELEKRYGELAKSSYAESNPAKMQNTPEVVEERIRKANEFLNIPTESWVPPKKDLQAFDRSLIKDAVEGFPGVSQSSFPRDVPTRASTEHVEELYSNPINRDLIERQIKRGLPLGGETFYASLYPVKQAALEAGVAPDKFEKWVHGLAPASARNSILNENAVGQFLRDMNARGIPLTEENVAVEMAKFKEKYGMGLPLMPIHRQGVANIVEGGMNLRDMNLANIPTNYKIPTYGTQKAGDFAKSVVLDVHEAGGQSQGSRYHPYFNEQGGFGNTEYGAGEAGLMSIANDIGIPGGMAQAGRWLGGGELTGLRSPRGDALDILERQIAYTLKAQGKQPNPTMIRNELLNQIDTGEGILLPWYKKESIPDVREIGLQRKKGGVVQNKADGGLTSDDLVLEERML